MADGIDLSPTIRKTLEAKIWERWLGNYDALMISLGVGAALGSATFGFVSGLAGAKHYPGLTGALVAVAIAGGALACGAFIGFLFGLPRTLTSNELRAVRTDWGDLGTSTTPAAASEAQTPENRERARQRAAYTDVNTNLEQISDWLTKIIVGVGLTQLGAIPGYLDTFGGNVDRYFNGGGFAYGVGGGLFFLTYGFFMAYVGTRVRLSLVFTTSQRLNNESADGSDPTTTALDTGSATDLTTPRGGDTVATARQGAAMQITEISTFEQLVAFGDAQFRDNNPAVAVAAYNSALRQRPNDANLLGKLAAALAAQGKSGEADGLVSTIRSLGTPEQAEAASTAVSITALQARMRNGLYAAEATGPADTLAAGEQLLRLYPAQEKDVWVQIWLACAYARESERTNSADQRGMAIAAVERALQIDPSMKRYLASLYDPSLVANGENDLVSLYGDPRLDLLLLDKQPG